jgi:hypothetical protein
LTFDVECAEERRHGDRIDPPMDFDLRVFGRMSNRKRELGIGLIMDELELFEQRGTFFVEVLATDFFGKAGLTEAVSLIRSRGHDVQLHMHPILKQADWLTKKLPETEDDIGAYPVEQQVAMLKDGIARLVEAGVPQNEIRGFRGGNYGIDNRTWRAMADVGLTLSSNYNLNYLGQSCRIGWPRTEIALFDTGEGVLELPISNFRDASGYRHLQIAAVSSSEMRHFLGEARRLGIPEVTIVSHSFEFFHVDSISRRTGRENTVNTNRLRTLCRFLADNQDDFQVDTVGRLAEQVKPGGANTRPPMQIPTGNPGARWIRMAEQAYKRAEARFPGFRRLFP